MIQNISPAISLEDIVDFLNASSPSSPAKSEKADQQTARHGSNRGQLSLESSVSLQGHCHGNFAAFWSKMFT